VTKAELALDADGHFLALCVSTRANLGAYVSTFGAAIPSAIYTSLLAGVYRTPAIFVESTGVFTNTTPTDAYRGAGRPEACYVLERLADMAAKKLGMDRVEIRRRNLISRSEMPYKTPLGPTYDSGDFPRILSRVQALAAYDRFELRRANALRRGRLRGSASPATLNPRALRRVSPARLARVPAFTRPQRSGWSPMGLCAPRSAPIVTGKATPLLWRKLSRRAWGSRWSKSK
jgi:CO/xanthine dehydrogenase Mo-binding subunit